jgi:calcineurin-like phosphoesterase family protein
MKRYVISDLHLGHEAILNDRTEFDTLYDMNSTIINNWNSVVTPQDQVYILGDVAWQHGTLQYIGDMNGKKILIKGNHDIFPLKYYLPYFNDIRAVMEYKGCILTHVPVHESQLKGFKINIHGHLHGKKIFKNVISVDNDGYFNLMSVDNRYINVCCEQVNYTPVLLEDIINDNDTRD